MIYRSIFPVPDRVIERFVNLLVIVPFSECWFLETAPSPDGYSHFAVSHTRQVRGHRFSYEYFIGPIPEGKHLDHLCRNRECVNPRHLDPVSCRENHMRAPGTMTAINSAKDRCIHGHECGLTFSAKAKYGRGERICKECKRLAWEDYDRRKQEEVSVA